tara:strand:- start:1521 stop:1823 length:303 start_codon:yes stop_codon:yes gene_type:complete
MTAETVGQITPCTSATSRVVTKTVAVACLQLRIGLHTVTAFKMIEVHANRINVHPVLSITEFCENNSYKNIAASISRKSTTCPSAQTIPRMPIDAIFHLA